MSDEYRPREHDHLVEPFFAGLRSGEKPESANPGGRGPGFLTRVFVRVWCWLRRMLGSG